MDKYHFNIRINKKGNNAGSKAIEDCKTILLKNDFKDLEVYFVKTSFLFPLNLIKLFVTLVYYVVLIKSKSFIVVQYPLLGINHFFKYFIKLLKLKRCKLCCIIHDLDSLRSATDQKNKVEKEIEALSAYDIVISHNLSMTYWLRLNGYRGHIEEILLFDYLVPDNNLKLNRSRGKNIEIAFAGNFSRGSFLKKLAVDHNLFYLNLYGSGDIKDVIKSNDKIKWYGSFSPDKIVNEINGDFGLIWDGDSVEEITGLTGNYLRFNTPHKTSLYLASGLPVIISKNAAIAPFVENNNIGFCIESLHEISTKANQIDNDLYKKMKENVEVIGKKLRMGYFLEKALENT